MELSFLPLLLALLLVLGLAGVVVVLGQILGPKRPTAVKQAPFESGHRVVGPGLQRFHVKFILVALLFLVFDIEGVFFYPWAVLFRARLLEDQSQAWQLLWQMLLFTATVSLGLVYIWQKGALDWLETRQKVASSGHRPKKEGF